MSYEEALERLSANKYGSFRCPAHGDKRSSGSIRNYPDEERWNLKCYAGCSCQEILSMMGLVHADRYYGSKDRRLHMEKQKHMGRTGLSGREKDYMLSEQVLREYIAMMERHGQDPWSTWANDHAGPVPKDGDAEWEALVWRLVEQARNQPAHPMSVSPEQDHVDAVAKMDEHLKERKYDTELRDWKLWEAGFTISEDELLAELDKTTP